jgi:gas vesicle protein
MFFSPTSGTYQRRKVKKERIRQVRTSSPIKILFLGVGSKVTSRKKMSNVKVQNPNQSLKKSISNVKNQIHANKKTFEI